MIVADFVSFIFLKIKLMSPKGSKNICIRLRNAESLENGQWWRIYLFSELKKFMVQEEITHQTTAPHTPQQNGVAVRKNRGLDAKLDKNYWAEAVHYTELILIFVGYSGESKAHRLLTIENNRITLN